MREAWLLIADLKKQLSKQQHDLQAQLSWQPVSLSNNAQGSLLQDASGLHHHTGHENLPAPLSHVAVSDHTVFVGGQGANIRVAPLLGGAASAASPPPRVSSLVSTGMELELPT